MEKIKEGWFYLAADGDGIGKLVGRAVIANDVEELHRVSNRIDAAQDLILHWSKDVGGIKISGGGDEYTAAIPPEAKDKIKDLRESVEKSFGYTISVGVGRNLSEAGTALLVAKLRGKNRIVYFNKHIKDDIKKAKRRVRENRATQEEYKLAEAYLTKADSMLCDLHKNELVNLKSKAPGKYIWTKPVGANSHGWHHENSLGSKIPGNNEKEISHILKPGESLPEGPKMHKHEEGFHNPQTNAGSDDPCPYCADNEDVRTDDCAYCQDLDAQENADGTAGMHDCPACKEYDASQQNTGGIDDCPYCQTENITQAQANPEKDQTDVAVADMSAQRPDDCPQCQEMYSDAVENEPGQTGQQDPNLQGHETAEEVLDLLDQEPGSGAQTPTQEAKKIDNTELPQGDQMKENKSVKEDFGQAQKNDVSDSEKQMSESGQPMSQSSPDMSQSGQDGPDMASVLQDGLDEHANDQKKQQVLDMVGQTLAGFKANKASLEATKEQNQALYNSCIQMLKSMIELCKLLGLEPKMPEQSMPQQDPGTPPQGAAPQAAPQEGAAQDPKTLAG